MMRFLTGLFGLSLLMSCSEPMPRDEGPHILLLGDSMMAANRAANASVADVVERTLGREVIDRSVMGASFSFLPIPDEYRPGNWDFIVMNGGGNDLVWTCGCVACDPVLNRLVAPDGRSGQIPEFVAKLRRTGATVIYAGYLRNPGTATIVKACGPAGNELDRRLATMAKHDPGFIFLTMADVVPYGDWTYHQIDLVHPSIKGSAAIGQRIAARIGALSGAKR